MPTEGVTGSSLLGNRHWYSVESPDGDSWRVVICYRGNPLSLPESISTQPLTSAVLAVLTDALLSPLGLLRGRRVGVFTEKEQEIVGRSRFATTVDSTEQADRLAAEIVEEIEQGRFRWDPQRSARSPEQMAEAKAAKLAESARTDSLLEATVRATVAAVVVVVAVFCVAGARGQGDPLLRIAAPSVLALALLTDAFRSVILQKPRGKLMGAESRLVCTGLAIFAALLSGLTQ